MELCRAPVVCVSSETTKVGMATKANIQSLLLSLVLVLVTTHSAIAFDCWHEKVDVIKKCKRTVRYDNVPYYPPTDECRAQVQRSDRTCICMILTDDDIGHHVSAKKLVRLAAECGKPVPVATRCGPRKFDCSAVFAIATGAHP
ncbi:hypothetical protein EJB05_40465, partial [Eragrostis curvula]